ncbi:DUF2231 domain-containing protein [Albibacterium bauzanense]|uniref:Putative membrane protein n=1 Tax=Albibacterium bauzanense TaxID=653929 RepID=A0A4R1M392_9SPHI|nr:DUF2231 domain-containing protein [Albibacterium bauzanense]TCK85314.1 putative membrane protein [Albibacterium bauzanense]
MKVFGHPIHVMLIHFPTALLPMELVFSAINYFNHDLSFLNASFYLMSAGVILGWVAIVFGAFDLIAIFENKPDAMNKALLHGGINTIVITVYTILAYIQYKNYPLLEPDSVVMLIIKVLTNAFLILGNFFGGDLILKYRVAVKIE